MNFNVQAIDRPDHIEQAGENETQDVIDNVQSHDIAAFTLLPSVHLN